MALKINGAFFGLINKNSVKGIKIDDSSTFIELCPTTSNFMGASFVLSNDFLTCPPNNISITNLKGGYLIKLLEQNLNLDFNIIAQEKFGDFLISIFNENGLKLSIETAGGFLAENFDFFSTTAKITRENINGFPLAFVHFTDKNLLAIYSLSDKPKRIFLKEIESFSVENGFIFTEKYIDIAKHKITYNTQFDGKAFTKISKNMTYGQNFVKENLTEKILPYAFLEELQVGGDISFYLDDSIKENADKLKNYLGDYIGIMPPPPFRNINEIGLIYSQTKNTFYVDYITVSLFNGKIDNIKRSAI